MGELLLHYVERGLWDKAWLLWTEAVGQARKLNGIKQSREGSRIGLSYDLAKSSAWVEVSKQLLIRRWQVADSEVRSKQRAQDRRSGGRWALIRRLFDAGKFDGIARRPGYLLKSWLEKNALSPAPPPFA